MVRERYKVRDELASQRDAFFQTVWSEKRRNLYGKMNEKVRRTAEISLISSTIEDFWNRSRFGFALRRSLTEDSQIVMKWSCVGPEGASMIITKRPI